MSEQPQEVTVRDLPSTDPRASRALVLQNLFFNKEAWMTMELMCKSFHASGALPAAVNNFQKALVMVQTGLEMGLTPMQSLNSLYLINGRVGVEGKVYLNKMYEAGVKIEWKKKDETGCEAVFTYKDRPPYTATFGKAEADRAGLSGKDNYKKWGKNMYMWKVVEDAGRFYVPEILFGAEIRESWDLDVIEVAAEAGPPVEAAVPSKLQTKAEKKEVKREEKKVAAAIPDAEAEAKFMADPEIAEIVEEAKCAETDEDFEGVRQMIVGKAWSVEAARFLGDKFVFYKDARQNKVAQPQDGMVDLAEEASKMDWTGEGGPVIAKPTREAREAELRAKKSVDLKPILSAHEIDFTGMDKEDRIAAILGWEYPVTENPAPSSPPVDSPAASAAPAPTERPKILGKLFDNK